MMSRQHVLITILFIAAAALRFADIFRPINQRSWRECDLGAVTRNFVREGLDPLYPSIDWRGDGPGYAEMELPLYPLLAASTYELLGEHDQILRAWSFVFSLGTLLFFWLIARQHLNIFASTVAFAFFALNPLMVRIGTSIQPEGIMLLTYLAAVFFFLRWLRTGSSRYFWAAAAATSLTLLTKAPAAHIGVFLGILLLQKHGIAAFKSARVYIFGVVALTPAALWYAHAKNLWLTYGNSLGVSNEYHWIGWDFFTDTSFVTGILQNELFYVWLTFGSVVAAFAIWRGYREETARYALVWLASIFLFYIVAARTTSEDWAAYYHVFSVAPVALLFGFAVKKLWDYAKDFADNYSRRSLVHRLSAICVMVIVISAIMASLRVEAKQVRANFVENHTESSALEFARRIRSEMPAQGLIVVSGGRCRDKNGFGVAYNASYMFYWLDRKGWNVCVEDHRIAKLNELAAKGAKYFIGEREYMDENHDFESKARTSYQVVDESPKFILFDLTTQNQP